MSLKLSSVGDIMLGENLHHYRRGVASSYHGRFSDLIGSEVRSVLNQTDLWFGNLECSLSADEEWRSAPLDRAIYAAPQSALSVFDDITPAIFFNVANNHFAQHGENACKQTLKFLEERNIRYFGRTADPCIISTREKRVVAWGVSLAEDLFNHGSYFQSTEARIVEDIQWVDKQDQDLWVVSIHWGEEYRMLPSEIQRRVAQALCDRGVDVVLGHHPHVVQPIEWFGKSVVCFSYGNFIFDQNFSRHTQRGLLTMIEVADNETFKLEACDVLLRRFATRQACPISLETLQQQCAKTDATLRPLVMRLLMKLELLFDFIHVPTVLWMFFIKRFLRKVKGVISRVTIS